MGIRSNHVILLDKFILDGDALVLLDSGEIRGELHNVMPGIWFVDIVMKWNRKRDVLIRHESVPEKFSERYIRPITRYKITNNTGLIGIISWGRLGELFDNRYGTDNMRLLACKETMSRAVANGFGIGVLPYGVVIRGSRISGLSTGELGGSGIRIIKVLGV